MKTFKDLNPDIYQQINLFTPLRHVSKSVNIKDIFLVSYENKIEQLWSNDDSKVVYFSTFQNAEKYALKITIKLIINQLEEIINFENRQDIKNVILNLINLIKQMKTFKYLKGLTESSAFGILGLDFQMVKIVDGIKIRIAGVGTHYITLKRATYHY